MVDAQRDALKYHQKGEFSFHTFDYNKAKQRYIRYFKLNSIDETALANTYDHYATCLASQFRFSEAIIKYRKAIQLEPKLTQAYTGWGLCLLKMGKYDDAIQKFNKAIEKMPKHPLAILSIILCLFLKKEDEKALKLFQIVNAETIEQILLSSGRSYRREALMLEKRLGQATSQEDITLIQEQKQGIKRLLDLLEGKQGD